MANNNNRMVVGGSFVRYTTTKTGTHIEFYDDVSKKRRRFNLAKLLNFQTMNLQQKVKGN